MLVGSNVDWYWEFQITRETFISSNDVEVIEDSTRIWVCERFLQVDCQISALDLEMNKDALQDAATWARQWASKRAFPLSHKNYSAS